MKQYWTRFRALSWWKQALAWVGTPIILIFVAATIAAIIDPSEEDGDDEATTEAITAEAETTAASPTSTATSQPTATATNAASASNFACRPKSVPEICSIAEQSFDQPLDAYGPVGDQSGPDYGVDYSFVVDTDQSAQAVAVQSEAQMAIAFKATSKKLQGQVNYVAASAYMPGDVPFYEFPLLSTSIGSAEMDQIAAGASPLNIWSVDSVDPTLKGFVDTG
jgi:pyruvate/2-oxoglutarate dehydrogenase complex dihydrolipoamide acyltransferase (E2) component